MRCSFRSYTRTKRTTPTPWQCSVRSTGRRALKASRSRAGTRSRPAFAVDSCGSPRPAWRRSIGRQGRYESGIRVDSADEGYQPKAEQAAHVLQPLGLADVAVTFFNAYEDSPETLHQFLLERVEGSGTRSASAYERLRQMLHHDSWNDAELYVGHADAHRVWPGCASRSSAARSR